jgi:capsular polysaccharide biosynthesis protein
MHSEQNDSLWQLIGKRKKILLFVSVAGILLSFVFSLPWMITPKYRSTVIMYPASTSSLSSSMLSDLLWSEEDLLEFGEREQANHLKQVLVSEPVRDRIVTRYKLQEHYKIDHKSSFPQTKLKREYERNVSVRINEFGAVELSVYDKDPQLAADMANKMAQLLDSAIHGMQQVRAVQAERIALDAYMAQESYIRSLEDSLSRIMVRGVHDYESQAQVLYEELAKRLGEGNRSAAAFLEKKLGMLAIYGGPYIAIQEELKLEKERLSILKAKYEKARMDSNQDLPQKFIVNDAYKAERKAYPPQWALVLGSGLSTFLFTLLMMLAYERYDRISALLSRQKAAV